MPNSNQNINSEIVGNAFKYLDYSKNIISGIKDELEGKAKQIILNYFSQYQFCPSQASKKFDKKH